MEGHERDLNRLVQDILEYERRLDEFTSEYKNSKVNKWMHDKNYGIIRQQIPYDSIAKEQCEERFMQLEYNRLVSQYNQKKRDLINYIRDIM